MRKPSAIFLALFFLFSHLLPARAKEELAKTPPLLRHFKEHRLETPGLTFCQFLQLHYGEEFAGHSHEHDHSQLPGKETCQQLHFPIPALPTAAFIEINAPPAIFAARTSLAGQLYFFLLMHDIWQPPRA